MGSDPEGDAPTRALTEPRGSDPAPDAGLVLGRYRLERMLGAGGSSATSPSR
jgi:hypothetical protein